MIKQLKNRFGDLGYYTRFVVGIDRSKMKLYDLEAVAQDGISQVSAANNTRQAEDKPTPTRTKKIDSSNFQF